MSRDWTPREQYLNYYYLLKKEGINMRSLVDRNANDDFGFLNFGLSYTDKDGKEVFQLFYPKKYHNTLRKYRELSFLFSKFLDVWITAKDFPRKRKKVLDKLESDLVIIEKFDIAKNLDKIPDTVDKELLMWYMGNPNQYTQEYFLERFSSYILYLITQKEEYTSYFNY